MPGALNQLYMLWQQKKGPTAGLEYFILPNKYEPGRAHIAIYNWEGAETVQLDVTNPGLHIGDIYELVNELDYYDEIITYTLDADVMITVLMTEPTFAPVIGSNKLPVSQFPIFEVFVIPKVGSKAISSISKIEINNSLNIYLNPTSAICKVNFWITLPG